MSARADRGRADRRDPRSTRACRASTSRARSRCSHGAAARCVERGGRSAAATRYARSRRDGGARRAPSGLHAHRRTARCRRRTGAIDTLIVPGGAGARAARARTPSWCAGSPRASARAAVPPRSAPARSCSPRAGLLDGRRATTHWAYAARARAAPPARRGRARPDLRARRRVWTSAGVTAGMDLALALVEEDLDRELALLIARHLVLFLRRPGNQSQFSATLAAQAARARAAARGPARGARGRRRRRTRSRRWPRAPT